MPFDIHKSRVFLTFKTEQKKENLKNNGLTFPQFPSLTWTPRERCGRDGIPQVGGRESLNYYLVPVMYQHDAKKSTFITANPHNTAR